MCDLEIFLFFVSHIYADYQALTNFGKIGKIRKMTRIDKKTMFHRMFHSRGYDGIRFSWNIMFHRIDRKVRSMSIYISYTEYKLSKIFKSCSVGYDGGFTIGFIDRE